MHILFALPGLHRVSRGAEIAFESVAEHIARDGTHRVTLVGSGSHRSGCSYKFRQLPMIFRNNFEHWPKLPFLRNEFMYEEATFAVSMLTRSMPQADLTVTCSYPYVNWALRWGRLRTRPPHVFVTQNGDWPAHLNRGQARFFSCEGLVCTNPIYFARNRDHWRAALIPNGVDPQLFCPGPDVRAQFGFPLDRRVVLMVSALEPGKRVLEAIRAVAPVQDIFLVVAGDGILRSEVDELATNLMPGRFLRRIYPPSKMPELYRSADVFLHTKIQESFGNVYVEALSTGIPIVAHDDEVTRWILRDHALLVDTTSPTLLTEAVTTALESGRRASLNAVEWAHATYSWSTVAKKYAEFFESVLEVTGEGKSGSK